MVILHGPAHPAINIKNNKQKHVVPIIFMKKKKLMQGPFETFIR